MIKVPELLERAFAKRVSLSVKETARLLGIDDVGPELGLFDTVVLLGNNIGLLGGPKKTPRLLAKLQSVTRPKARILGTSVFLYDTEDPVQS